MKIVQDSQRQFSPWLIASWLMIGLGGGHAALPPPQMTYLDNGEVRVGMDLSLGGAVTFISSHDHPANLINSADLGRQIQMSHYSGPWPFEPGGKKPTPAWAGLGWNPIQTGDCHLNPSRVLESRNQGGELYIKCVPMQWPLDQVPGDCLFETWTTLEGPVIHMRFRCTNQRDDHAVYRPCAQELPAVYTISTLCRLMAYTGEEPFTGGALTRVANDWHQPWPWTRFIASERWVALVDTNDWGLGVFKDDGGQFDGGIYGDGRSTDPKDGSTAYVAPIHTENFDFNIVYEHRTDFMVGRLADIRSRFTAQATRTPPAWRFLHDRQHWTLSGAVDRGFPWPGEWRATIGTERPRWESPVQCWRADAAPVLALDLACTGPTRSLRLFWRRLQDKGFNAQRSLPVSVDPDGRFHQYRVDLGAAPEYRGLLTGLCLEPEGELKPGSELTLKSLVLSPRDAAR